MRISTWIHSTLTCAILSSAAFAADGWERGSAYNKNFDSHNIQTITGKVVRVDRDFHPLPGMAAGFMSVTKTDKREEVQVQVGPIWFTGFYRQKWNIQVGDSVKITGSRVKIGGKDVIMATETEKGNLKMTIRSHDGVPV